MSKIPWFVIGSLVLWLAAAPSLSAAGDGGKSPIVFPPAEDYTAVTARLATNAFPEEHIVMAAYQASPTQPNRARLAEGRYVRSIDLAGYARERHDSNAFRLALGYAESATQLMPRKAVYWFALGRLYTEMENNPRADAMAEDALGKAINLDGGLWGARALLGEVLFRQTRFDRALHEFETAIELNPKLVAPQMVIAMCDAYLIDFQWERGQKFFRNVLARQPAADCARLALAILLHQQKKNAEAESELKQVKQREGVSPENKRYAEKLLREWKKEKVLS